jgi:hypothetical protein
MYCSHYKSMNQIGYPYNKEFESHEKGVGQKHIRFQLVVCVLAAQLIIRQQVP